MAGSTGTEAIVLKASPSGMSSRSPVSAMLWEQWRLTRVEAAQRFAVGIVAGAGALILFNHATAAFWILVAVHAYFWFSISKLNGGKFSDGYKPGFPLHLLYARPVSTTTFVGVAMLYDAVSCAALYLLSALLLQLAFGEALPLFSVALCIVVFHLACTCMQWSTRSRFVQWGASIVVGWPIVIWFLYRAGSSLALELSPVESVLMVLIGVASLGLTIVGVARQRRGDSTASAPQPKAASGGYPDWMINFFRFPCPTSSATRAQVWSELKSSGLPVLAIGLGIATLILLLFAISVPFAPARHAAVAAIVLSVPFALFALGNNAFGIRRKQGRTYASAFEATQPLGTAQLAGIKVLVRTVCVLPALIAIGVSVWASSAFVSDWGVWMPSGGVDAVPGLLKVRQKFAQEFGGLTWYAHAALALVASIVVAGVIAWQAAREALRARYSRVLLIVQWLPAGWGFASILLAVAGRNDVVPMTLVRSFLAATFWSFGIALMVVAVYLLSSGFARRALTIRYVCGALAISAASGVAWMAAMPAPHIIGVLWLTLAVLTLIVLAPWSLNRIRHT